MESRCRGGYVVYLRHALTNPNRADDGRQMARDIGAAFKTRRIRVEKVGSSPYCRTVDTAELAFDRHDVSPGMYFAMGVAKGDAHVFRPGPTGFICIGEVAAEEWVRRAREAAAAQ
jgi:broad specificity phosphatase PhoE